MNVIVTLEDFDEATDEGTVLVLTGTEEGTGDRITFAGDWRPMQNLLEAAQAEGEATAEIESWQILRREESTDGLVDAAGTEKGQLGWLGKKES